jgi:hypothetical protein
VLEALPGIAFVVDEVGTISYHTAQAAEAVGRPGASLIGESVLGFVSHETAWAYASAVAMAGDYPDVTMGPLRIEIQQADGARRNADLWATNRLDDPTIGGIVCLITQETAAVGLAEAVSAVAEHVAVDTIAGHVVGAMRGNPVVADAAFVVPDPDQADLLVLSGPTQLPVELVDAAHPAARAAIATGVRQIHGDLTALGPVVADIAGQHGFSALWVEPTPAGGPPAPGALVLWRRRPGAPSPNQLTSVYQGAAILGLAHTRDRLGIVT